MSRLPRDTRLLAPAGATWLAAWCTVAAPDLAVGAWLPVGALWTVAGGLAVVLVATAFRARTSVLRRWRPHLAALLLAVSAAGLAAHAAAVAGDVRAAAPLHAAAAAHDDAEVAVEVTSTPRTANPGPVGSWPADEPQVRFRGSLLAVDGEHTARVPVTVVASADARFAFGARAAFTAHVSANEAADPSAYRLRPVGEVDVAPPDGPLGWAADLRHRFAEAAGRLGGDAGALVPGLAIGDTSAVGAELDADMKVSSLTHLTAVSGANCAIVTALVFALAAACGAPRAVRVLAALVALGGFVLLVTPESSVVRAAAMAVVVLVAAAVGRPGGGVAALSLAVIVLLTVNPWYARDYGFALSVCATAGLLLLAGPLGDRLARYLPRPLALALAVPLAAQLACQPVLILLDPSIAAFGVAANLIAAPAAPVATMVGLAGCLLLPLFPSLGFAALQIAAVPAGWIAQVAHGVALLPGARIPWPAEAAGALLLAAGTAAGLWLALAQRRPRWAVRSIAGVLLVALAAPLGVSVAGPALSRAWLPPDWIVAACDVGQGDAVLVRDGGAVALIDTGPEEAALARCLALTGVEAIDLLVLTHWDADHVAAVGAIAGRVRTVLHGPLDGARSSRALRPLVDSGAEAREVTAGVRGRLGGAEWEVLWPPPDEAPGNDASVVLDLRAARFSAVFLGDLGETAQARMARASRPSPVDLVKVAHHGSADQNPSLYAELDARVAVIGVGEGNGYGHPTRAALDLVAEQGAAVVRTDHLGTALLSVDDGVFRLWSERRGAGRRHAERRRRRATVDLSGGERRQ